MGPRWWQLQSAAPPSAPAWMCRSCGWMHDPAHVNCKWCVAPAARSPRRAPPRTRTRASLTSPPEVWGGWQSQKPRGGRAATDLHYRVQWPALAQPVRVANRWAVLEQDAPADETFWFNDTSGDRAANVSAGGVAAAPTAEEAQQTRHKELTSEKRMVVNMLHAAKRDDDGSACFGEAVAVLAARVETLNAKLFEIKPHSARLQSSRAKETSALAKEADDYARKVAADAALALAQQYSVEDEEEARHSAYAARAATRLREEVEEQGFDPMQIEPGDVACSPDVPLAEQAIMDQIAALTRQLLVSQVPRYDAAVNLTISTPPPVRRAAQECLSRVYRELPGAGSMAGSAVSCASSDDECNRLIAAATPRTLVFSASTPASHDVFTPTSVAASDAARSGKAAGTSASQRFDPCGGKGGLLLDPMASFGKGAASLG